MAHSGPTRPKTAPKPIDKETDITTRKDDLLGYARVSTVDQDTTGQKDRLTRVGAIRVFADVISGDRAKRPGLVELIDHARPGDSLCVARLDRLGRPLKELLKIVENPSVGAFTWSASKCGSTRHPPPVSWYSMSSEQSPISSDS